MLEKLKLHKYYIEVGQLSKTNFGVSLPIMEDQIIWTSFLAERKWKLWTKLNKICVMASKNS